MTGSEPGRGHPSTPGAVAAGCVRSRPEQAVAWVEANTASLPAEKLALADAGGRTLASAWMAPSDLPRLSVAAGDGYALSAAATVGASDYNPLPFRLAPAGTPPPRPLGPAEAAPVHSGEPLPPGADAVVAVEEASVRGDTLEVGAAVAVGANTIGAGEEMARGQPVLESGRRLRAQDLALLAMANVERVEVVRRPRVRLLLGGAGLASPDALMVRGLLRRDGAELEDCQAVADAEALATCLREPGADLILVCGGSGDGANDYGAATLARSGRMEFGGIAMNPGETTRLGRVGTTPVMLLPGAPLACLYAYEWFAGRAVRRLAGGSGEWPYGTRRARLSRKVASTLGRLEFCRVRLDGDKAEPLAITDGRLLVSAARADGFVPIAPSSEGHPEQTEVTVWLHTTT